MSLKYDRWEILKFREGIYYVICFIINFVEFVVLIFFIFVVIWIMGVDVSCVVLIRIW